MKTILIYKSKTGFTKKYAEWIQEELNCEISDYSNLKKYDLNEFDLLIYGSRVHAGRIDGLEKMKKIIQNKKCHLIIFITGATPIMATEAINKIMNDNKSLNDDLIGHVIPHFYMQSGLCYEKMGLVDKLIMKLFAKMLSKKENKSDIDGGTANAISQSYDISDKKYIAPLINFVKEHYEKQF